MLRLPPPACLGENQSCSRTHQGIGQQKSPEQQAQNEWVRAVLVEHAPSQRSHSARPACPQHPDPSPEERCDTGTGFCGSKTTSTNNYRGRLFVQPTAVLYCYKVHGAGLVDFSTNHRLSLKTSSSNRQAFPGPLRPTLLSRGVLRVGQLGLSLSPIPSMSPRSIFNKTHPSLDDDIWNP